MKLLATRNLLLLLALLAAPVDRVLAQPRFSEPPPKELARTLASLDGAWRITRVISYDHGPAQK